MQTQSIAVIHLVWLPLGVDVFKDFIKSYKAFPSGYPHDLIILFNGVKDKEATNEFHNFLRNQQISYTPYYLPEGQDIKAYHWLALQLKHHYLLFFNSYSRLLADNWLQHFMNAIQQDNIGMVGATGSWQSYFSTVFKSNRFAWEKNKSINDNFRKYKLLVKAFFYWRLLFKPFPNPHIRTTAFIIKRENFILSYRNNVDNKFNAYLFESGRRGLSNQLLNKGFTLLVLDKFGRTYDIKDWPLSLTFCISKQENLMVSDNRTRDYDYASKEQQNRLTYLAWGKHEKI